MAGSISIAGFSSTDKVPGAYGEIKYGSGGQSAASIPLLLLLVGLASAGATATPDTEVIDVYDESIANASFVAGSELACMCYDALSIPGVAVKALAVTGAGGAVAATAIITIAGTATATCDWEYFIGGKSYSGSIAAGDTPTTTAAALASACNADPKCPLSASAAVGAVTFTCKTPGARGNQHILRQNRKKLVSPVTSTLSGAGTVIDTDRIFLGGGSGVETFTNALSALRPSQYDRIALAANDATSLAAWETQLDLQAGVLEGLLQQVVVATNGAQASATTLSTTTLNNPLFEQLWTLNHETHPSRTAAQFAAIRVQKEQNDPGCAFDGEVLPSAAPQNRGDWPKHSNQVAALNNGVTPCTGGPDGKVRVVRAITTKCLNGATPDYSTLDTAEVSVPQFILKDLKLFWVTDFLPNNPRTADNDPSGKPRPAGVATPDVWNSEVEVKLRSYESGKYGGRQNNPLIIDVDTNKPTSSYDGIGERIMTAVPSKVAPSNHQVGISVRQI